MSTYLRHIFIYIYIHILSVNISTYVYDEHTPKFLCFKTRYPKVQRNNYLSTYLYYTLKKLTFEIIYLSYCRNILKILVFFWWYYIFPFFFISYDIYISTFINSIYSQKFSLETVYKVWAAAPPGGPKFWFYPYFGGTNWVLEEQAQLIAAPPP